MPGVEALSVDRNGKRPFQTFFSSCSPVAFESVFRLTCPILSVTSPNIVLYQTERVLREQPSTGHKWRMKKMPTSRL
ncbi:hypothetical protein JCM6292_3537 [Bacteroides pyogenes JCM 6292]|uniref:Uncharacterized protein n=1 Tax=Bacteroides pyogenes JCM 6292 TaxID=1235809 RepID=W4PB70_9BACE|nr:hypothetical protein JCM6292_3537 [Bacteroides pyogenes JCM 6292]